MAEKEEQKWSVPSLFYRSQPRWAGSSSGQTHSCTHFNRTPLLSSGFSLSSCFWVSPHSRSFSAGLRGGTQGHGNSAFQCAALPGLLSVHPPSSCSFLNTPGPFPPFCPCPHSPHCPECPSWRTSAHTAAQRKRSPLTPCLHRVSSDLPNNNKG